MFNNYWDWLSIEIQEYIIFLRSVMLIQRTFIKNRDFTKIKIGDRILFTLKNGKKQFGTIANVTDMYLPHPLIKNDYKYIILSLPYLSEYNKSSLENIRFLKSVLGVKNNSVHNFVYTYKLYYFYDNNVNTKYFGTCSVITDFIKLKDWNSPECLVNNIDNTERLIYYLSKSKIKHYLKDKLDNNNYISYLYNINPLNYTNIDTKLKSIIQYFI